MARTKKTVVSGISREQAEQAFADFAAADAKVQNLTSKMDLEMTRIREKYADQLAELSATKEKNFDIMQAYAVENKEELFSRKKSLESAHGVFGFRTGTPKLKNLKGFTWAAVFPRNTRSRNNEQTAARKSPPLSRTDTIRNVLPVLQPPTIPVRKNH